MENSKFNVSDASTLFFFSRPYKRSKHGSSYHDQGLPACRRLLFPLEIGDVCTQARSRVNLYRNDLRGNKNYFELAGGSTGSSYRG